MRLDMMNEACDVMRRRWFQVDEDLDSAGENGEIAQMNKKNKATNDANAAKLVDKEVHHSTRILLC